MAHLPLLLSPDGDGKLSKRDGDKYGFPVFPLEWNDPFTGAKFSGYRETGYLPEAVVNTLALLGWNPGDNREIFSLQELVELFSLERVGKSGVKFDKKKSVWFNQYYLKQKPDAFFLPLLKEKLAAENLPIPSDEKLCRIIGMLKERVEYLGDFFAHGQYFFRAPTAFDPDLVAKKWNREFVAAVNDVLSELENWTAKDIETVVKTRAENMNLPPGKVMPALRLAVSGVGFGPGIYDIMEIIGKQETLQRLHYALQTL
jgi:glutamyl-tRNA synthetase